MGVESMTQREFHDRIDNAFKELESLKKDSINFTESIKKAIQECNREECPVQKMLE